jgi:hypothetical protein
MHTRAKPTRTPVRTSGARPLGCTPSLQWLGMPGPCIIWRFCWRSVSAFFELNDRDRRNWQRLRN